MQATELLERLRRIFVRCTREMLLEVNPDTGIYEDSRDLPIEPGGDWEDDWPDPDGDREPAGPAAQPPAGPQEGEPKRRAPEVYVMGLPDPEDVYSRIPYIILQLLEIKDEEQGESTAQIRAVIAVYSADGQEGGLQVLQIIERIRTVLERGILLAENYVLQFPLKCEVYPDDTGRYFLGEMTMTWSLPEIRRTHRYVETAAESGSLEESGLLGEDLREEDLWGDLVHGFDD